MLCDFTAIGRTSTVESSRHCHCCKAKLQITVIPAVPAHSGIHEDNPVGLLNYFGWYGNAKSLGGLKVDHELVG
jgi:hypothetical protein